MHKLWRKVFATSSSNNYLQLNDGKRLSENWLTAIAKWSSINQAIVHSDNSIFSAAQCSMCTIADDEACVLFMHRLPTAMESTNSFMIHAFCQLFCRTSLVRSQCALFLIEEADIRWHNFLFFHRMLGKWLENILFDYHWTVGVYVTLCYNMQKRNERYDNNIKWG